MRRALGVGKHTTVYRERGWQHLLPSSLTGLALAPVAVVSYKFMIILHNLHAINQLLELKVANGAYE